MQQEDREWEFYMHKVNGQLSFADFRNKLHGGNGAETSESKPSDEDLRAIIESSKAIAGIA